MGYCIALLYGIGDLAEHLLQHRKSGSPLVFSGPKYRSVFVFSQVHNNKEVHPFISYPATGGLMRP